MEVEPASSSWIPCLLFNPDIQVVVQPEECAFTDQFFLIREKAIGVTNSRNSAGRGREGSKKESDDFVNSLVLIRFFSPGLLTGPGRGGKDFANRWPDRDEVLGGGGNVFSFCGGKKSSLIVVAKYISWYTSIIIESAKGSFVYTTYVLYHMSVGIKDPRYRDFGGLFSRY